MIKKDKDKLYKLLSILVLVCVMASTLIYIKNHMYLRLNSDDSSELLLNKLLASENSLLTKNWYYSTELKVLNTNLIYSLVFRFTNNFLTVRIISYAIMWAILLIVYLGLCKALNIKKNSIISACLLFIPFSNQYYAYVLSTSHYLPFITISFLTIMLSELYINKKKTIYLIISAIVSLLAGLGGPRQMMVTYVPLFVSSFLQLIINKEKDYSFIKFTLISAVFGGLGYIINSKVLSNIYTFKSYSQVGFKIHSDDILENIFYFLKDGLANIFYSFKGTLHAFGILTDKISFLSVIEDIVGIVWILLTIYAIYYSLRYKEKVSSTLYRLSSFIFMDHLVFISLYIFTDMVYADRYLLPITILSIPLIVLFLQEVDVKTYSFPKQYLCAIFTFLVFIQGISYMYSFKDLDTNIDQRNILNFLNENDYKNGYATFWSGNIYTELSNGDIDMWVWCDGGIENVDDVNTTLKWLQLKSHDYEKPSGKVFMLFSTSEYEKTPFKEYLKESDAIYESDEHIIFGFDSYEDMCLQLG